jgi:hypothetical protein
MGRYWILSREIFPCLGKIPERACWQAKSNWNAEISMTPAKRLRESLYFIIFPQLKPAL